MLISARHNFLFVHIAKTGGTSVRRALVPSIWKDRFWLLQRISSRLSRWSGHRIGAKLPRHAKAVAAQEMLPDDFFRKLFKFAFVRNPWDLQVSSYLHVRRERPEIVAHLDSFEAFLEWKFLRERPSHYILDASTEPQRRSLVDLQGQVIVDYVGRYERLEEDFHEVCRRIGLPAIALPHKRKAPNRSGYRAYYNDRTYRIVARHYLEDIDGFQYSF
ncbi:MAG: sulfotransferase family protein [Synergistales bacterium]|nr:sulfotransferase family protein [Synergistales bacterium]